MIDPRVNRLEIQTPEGIAFPIALAGPVARFLAWGVDSLVFIAVGTVFGLLAAVLGVVSSDLGVAVYAIFYFAFSICYAILLEWFWRGQTLGKFVLGLRVMDASALPLTFSQVALRNLLRFVDNLPLFYLVGGTALLLNRRNQRLGDLAANTIVILVRKAPPPDLELISAEKYNSFRNYPHIEARLRQRVTPEEAAVAVRALSRRTSLNPDARLRLFKEIADLFRQRATFPEEATLGLSDEQYVRNVVECLYLEKPNAVVPKVPLASGEPV